MSFKHLRQTPWDPCFTWVGSAAKAAYQINSFHEDHPRRVGRTVDAIERLERHSYVPNAFLKLIHLYVFGDTPHRGQWRKADVQVGLHRPPDWQLVPGLMDELAATSAVRLVDGYEGLEAWYSDFETIHPFQDGNGRVGAIVVCVYSHALHPERGWLTVCQ